MFFNFLIVAAGILVLILILVVSKALSEFVNFYATGLDSKFNLFEITMLWKLAKETGLESPLSLYVSDNALTTCISKTIEKSEKEHKKNDPKNQEFLAKLYKFRTKLMLNADSKRGLSSTKFLKKDQRLRIVLKGSGVFSSRIMNNSSEMAISVPMQGDRIPIKAEDWVGKEINVYFWRKDDAGYAFDTKVVAASGFLGRPALQILNSSELTRMQKRRSIRTECKINAQLYLVKETVVDFTRMETAPGFKCLIEDISSDGALIRIGGKGMSNVQMKLQFEIEHTPILMYGTVRSVEFNAANNQSRLHLECTHIEPYMKNAILAFVYKIMPEEKKNAELALKELEDEDTENSENGEDKDVTSRKDDGFSIDIPTAIYENTKISLENEYRPAAELDAPPPESNSAPKRVREAEFDPTTDPDYDPKYGY